MFFFFFQAEDGIRDYKVTGVQTCALPIFLFASVRTGGEETERFTDAVKGWIDVTLEERVPVLVAGLGNPGPVTAEAHRLGITVMALCGNVKQARDHAANGVDVVIAQGHEAGG